jgi:ferredoxin
LIHIRLENHPILTFNKGPKVKFLFNGQEVEGYQGEPIAAALHAQGIRVLKHSHRHHRPRGFFCAIGNCSSCNMQVNGIPNVRVCVEPLQDGMVVESQEGQGKLHV